MHGTKELLIIKTHLMNPLKENGYSNGYFMEIL
jgi:hypothetical protein